MSRLNEPLNSADQFFWTCPNCQRASALTKGNISESQHTLSIENAMGRQTLSTTFFVCTNPECRKFTLLANLNRSSQAHNEEKLEGLVQAWQLIPKTQPKEFSSSVPQALLEDYREACLTRELSPRASAALCRRCLQGMLVDHWQAAPGELSDQFSAIQALIDQPTRDEIETLRNHGRIGIHWESNVNLLLEVEPDEADLLIELVERLLVKWYGTSRSTATPT